MIQDSTPKLWFNFLKHLINFLKKHAACGMLPVHHHRASHQISAEMFPSRGFADKAVCPEQTRISFSEQIHQPKLPADCKTRASS